MNNKTSELINKFKQIHGDKYDYSLVNFINTKTKVKIICPIHGIFEQNIYKHLNGQNCGKCKGKNLTNEDIIKKSKEIHGDKYDYSLVNYKTFHKNIKIICPIHGYFFQTPHNHIYYKNGCPKCSSTYRKTTENFIKESKKMHGNKYDYSLVNYINNETKVKIICPKHGVFQQKPNSHLRGSICKKCSNEIISESKRKSTEQFIKESKEIHGDKYDYSLVNYINSNIKVKIICPIHGLFEQNPNSHLSNHGCPICKESKGEKQIRILLENNNIKYISQKKFKGCKNKFLLPFDFYLPKQNTCIEFDGKHHFEINNFFGGKKSFKNIKKNDNIKNDFCKNYNIKIIRIKYTENIRKRLIVENII
jgi:hypothetical protein